MTERQSINVIRPRGTLLDLVEQSIARGEDLATTMRKTGCRPQDVLNAQARMDAAIADDHAKDLVPLGPPRPAVCGTEAGAKRHYRLGEDACSRCRAAVRWSARDRAAKRGAA